MIKTNIYIVIAIALFFVIVLHLGLSKYILRVVETGKENTTSWLEDRGNEEARLSSVSLFTGCIIPSVFHRVFVLSRSIVSLELEQPCDSQFFLTTLFNHSPPVLMSG